MKAIGSAVAFAALVLAVGFGDGAPAGQSQRATKAPASGKPQGRRSSQRRSGCNEKRSPSPKTAAADATTSAENGLALLRRLSGHWEADFGEFQRVVDLHVNADGSFNLDGEIFQYTYWNVHLGDKLNNLTMGTLSNEALDELTFPTNGDNLIVRISSKVSPLSETDRRDQFYMITDITLTPSADGKTLLLHYGMACTPFTVEYRRVGEAKNRTAPAEIGREVGLFEDGRQVERPLESKRLRVDVPESARFRF